MLFDRSYNEQFTKEIFKVRQIFRMQEICMYKLKDFLNEEINEISMQVNYKKSQSKWRLFVVYRNNYS